MVVLRRVLPQGYFVAETVLHDGIRSEEHIKTRSLTVAPVNGSNGFLARVSIIAQMPREQRIKVKPLRLPRPSREPSKEDLEILGKAFFTITEPLAAWWRRLWAWAGQATPWQSW